MLMIPSFQNDGSLVGILNDQDFMKLAGVKTFQKFNCLLLLQKD